MTPEVILRELAKIHIGDILLETTEGQQLALRRVSRPDAEQKRILAKSDARQRAADQKPNPRRRRTDRTEHPAKGSEPVPRCKRHDFTPTAQGGAGGSNGGGGGAGLAGGLFTRNPAGIAEGLKRSAEHRTNDRSKSRSDYQAAMSMLNFYINRAGRNLPATTKNRLEKAKGELRRLYGRD